MVKGRLDFIKKCFAFFTEIELKAASVIWVSQAGEVAVFNHALHDALCVAFGAKKQIAKIHVGNARFVVEVEKHEVTRNVQAKLSQESFFMVIDVQEDCF